ncbi:MAG: YraN family protein [Patescibacteria group bacterium]
MSFERKKIGKFGEDLAVSFLKKKGYKIIERNFFIHRLGEIDIVSEHGGRMVFVEVRTKSGNSFCSPEESIGPRKKQKLILMAASYLESKKLWHKPYGIDGVFIEGNNGRYEIRHLENIIEI